MRHMPIEYAMRDDCYEVEAVAAGSCVKLNFVSLTLENRKFSSRQTGINHLRARGWTQADAEAYMLAIREEVSLAS